MPKIMPIAAWLEDNAVDHGDVPAIVILRSSYA